MKTTWFHHPNYCATVIRRRLTAELLDMAEYLGMAICTRGRSFFWNQSQPSRTRFSMAQYRLLKSGLIARQPENAGPPTLILTEKGRQRISPELHPLRYWNTPWSGLWYVLVYDVPETQRRYREALRKHLMRLRMGQLQRSVWISARDLRPDFDDLNEAAAVNDFACLFEAHTVLGLSGPDLAGQAWDFAALRERHEWYLTATAEVQAQLKAGEIPASSRARLLSEELQAYLAVMRPDPLLPRALWPADYQGEAVFETHRAATQQIGALH